VKWLLIITAFLYAEAVFQSTVAMAEDNFPDDEGATSIHAKISWRVTTWRTY
jgi:hypothetical protein